MRLCSLLVQPSPQVARTTPNWLFTHLEVVEHSSLNEKLFKDSLDVTVVVCKLTPFGESLTLND